MKQGDRVLFRDPRAFGGDPQLAFVTRVWGPQCLNLHVIDPNGACRGETSVQHKSLVDGYSHWLTVEEYEAEQLAVQASTEVAPETEAQ